MKRVAHFLLHEVLAESPPNDALIAAWLELGFGVDVFAPEQPRTDRYGPSVRGFRIEGGYGWRSSANGIRRLWPVGYQAFSATAEDPFILAWGLSKLTRRPFVALLDEIKSGSYWGDRSRRWKNLIRAAIRDAGVCIVNDESRISLVSDYAGRQGNVIVYPGAFRDPPASERDAQRRKRGFDDSALVLGLSGGVNQTSGFHWALDCLDVVPQLQLLIQAVNLSPMETHLLNAHRNARRMFIESGRLGWREAWASAAACDIGLAVYLNQAPQFQHMGIASNRLCMFLAMGVPVIASRQPSFEFIERYDCGVLVDGPEAMAAAVERISQRLPQMRANALTCAREYIRAGERWLELRDALARVLGTA